jgi:uncharacterized LabA/DUF88 family protein
MTKTIVYIDGYNLYYSRLRGGTYKWLDVVALFDTIVHAQKPSSYLIEVKYFTAPIKASFASHGDASAHAQIQYLRALQALHPERLTVIQGFHTLQAVHRPSYVEGQAASKSARSAVWEIEEKQTDVNLALHLYSDVIQGRCQQAVICSNDSDLEPALAFIWKDAPQVSIGLVLPLTEPAKQAGLEQRFSNKRLTPLSHWVRHYLRDDELAKAQLPQSVNTRKKPATKPLHW